MTTTILAADDAAVPISFGYHTYLRLPGVDRGEWEVGMPVSERLELDRRMLPTGAREPVRVEAGPLGARTFDDAYGAPGAGRRSSSPEVGAGSSSASEAATASPRSMRPPMTT